jgi:8-oxo-dGTP pyrophosphatase MutT (NUDIX family)
MMAYEVVRSQPGYNGAIVRVRVDTVVLPDGSEADPEVVEHTGSVAIVVVDSQQRVLLIRQYRHPVGNYLWELPAGLRDEPGEHPLDTARRELAEETGLEAGSWSTLVDLRPSPGMSTEVCRVYQAEQLTGGKRRGDQEGEEDDLQFRWVPMPDALAEVLDGRITNGLAVSGLLAVVARFGQSGDHARPADTPWPGGDAK